MMLKRLRSYKIYKFKRAFSLLEILLSIFVVSFFYYFFNFALKDDKLHLFKKQLILHLKYTRFIAFNDSKFDINDSSFYRTFWKLKFRRCNHGDGAYYLITSDSDKNGYIKKEECLKDPLTNKYIYNYGDCVENQFDKLENTLLKKFGITNINISCNKTDSIGEFSFDDFGKVYTKLAPDEADKNKYILDKDCIITFSNGKRSDKIIITKNGYIY